MLIVKTRDTKEIYILKRIHFFLGIEFLDNVELSINFSGSRESEYPLIVISKKVSNKQTKKNHSTLFLESNLADLIFSNLSMSSEMGLKEDKFGRKISTTKRVNSMKEPLIDKELKKVKNKVLIFLKKNNLTYKERIPLKHPIVCLTHDVDSIKSNSFIRKLFWIFKDLLRLSFTGVFLNLKKLFIFEQNTHGDFRKFVEIEKNFSFKSTYFFLSLPFFISWEGRRYSLKTRWIQESINFLIRENFEVGLHLSRRGYKKSSKAEIEKIRLENTIKDHTKISGVRNHYLAGSFPAIWKLHEKNYDYDSSLGWSSYLGYRAATSRPFRPFDNTTGKELEIYELPLIVMDGAIKKSNAEEIFNEIKPYIDHAYEDNGVITILWHTDRILPGEFTEYSKAYEHLLSYLKKLEFLSLTAKEVVNHFKEYEKDLGENFQVL